MQKIFEKVRNYPIKFYRNQDGVIEYESAYISGKARSLELAMHKIADSQEKLLFDLYNYDDVLDVQIGQYEIPDKPRKSRGREYLGQISVKIDLNDWTGSNTLKHVAKNPQDLKKHQDLVQKWRWQKNKEKFLRDLKDFFKRLNPTVNENRRYTMDVTKKYVLKFMHESRRTQPKSMKSSALSRPAFEDNADWYFNPSDIGMSGAATYTYAKPVMITNDAIMYDSEANIMGKELIPEIVGKEIEDSIFMILQSLDIETPFGYHCSIYVDDHEIMIYDYADSIEELERILSQDFLPYTNLTLDQIPTKEFAAKVAEIPEAQEEEVPAEEADVQDLPEESVNEASKFYTFHIPCVASIVVNADSEDLAKELLRNNSEIELTEYLEFAYGDIELRALDLDKRAIDSLDSDEFDPES